MIKLLHSADLHLKAPDDEDSTYSLDCLEILLRKANDEKVDAVLLCGDIFDKESDYSHKEFCQRIVSLFDSALMPIYYIPGNHEDLTGKFAKLKTIDWGKKLKLISDNSIITHSGDLEILAIPHSPNFENYTNWDLPKKKTQHRIAMAHGEIPGFTFLGDEEGAGVLNPAIFIHFEVSHVLLGHIHLPKTIEQSGIQFSYCGSPRVVRKKEIGTRNYNIVQVSDVITITKKDLPEVGVVRNLTTTVMDHNWVRDIEIQCEEFSPADRVHVTLSGLVQDHEMVRIEESLQALKASILRKCRRVDFVRNLEPLNDLIQNPFYKKVYELWLTKKPMDITSKEYTIWLQMLDSLKFVKEKVL